MELRVLDLLHFEKVSAFGVLEEFGYLGWIVDLELLQSL